MGHICNYVDRIEVETDWETEQKFLVRTVNAEWYDKKKSKLNQLDVYREYQKGTWYGDERFFARHIVYGMCGYTVYFVGEKAYTSGYNYYYGNHTCTHEEDWQPYGNKRIGGLYCLNTASQQDIDNILEVYPEFKYVINKMNPSLRTNKLLMDIINIYMDHPECEALISLGLYRIALNEQLYKLTLPKRKEVIKYISKHHDELYSMITLRDIQSIIKNKTDARTWNLYDRSLMKTRKRKFEEWQYLVKKGYLKLDAKTDKERIANSGIQNYYDDYLDMCKKVGHDMTDPYWHYPSDIYKMHERVMEELKNVNETASKLKNDYLKAVCEPMKKYDDKVNGYDIFIADDIEIIKKQCDALYQCLIRNGYITKVLMQEEILIFIWKDGEPKATAEIFYNGKLGQFYADEAKHRLGDDCLPDDEIQAAFNEWFKKFKPIKAKAPKNKEHYYKGFYKVSAAGIYTGWNDFKFEVGKTYETKFDDDTIYKTGGQGCNATSKVFHFCNSISEISNHYQPKVYCEIEPLGAVVEYNGAMLSNKIKILRALDQSEVNKLVRLEKGLI